MCSGQQLMVRGSNTFVRIDRGAGSLMRSSFAICTADACRGLAVAVLLAMMFGCQQAGSTCDQHTGTPAASQPAETAAAGEIADPIESQEITQSQPAVVDDGQYYLPFAAGTTHLVVQSYFGVAGFGSHKGQYAIDFLMPLHTPILAARAGIVVEVRDTCPNVNCPFDQDSCCGNFIRIEHPGGARTAYWHLVQGGSCVRPGDGVARGDIIGHSGNTGISMGPHLHFAVFAPKGEVGTGSHGPSRDGSMEAPFADVPCGAPLLLGSFTSRNEVSVDHCDTDE